MHEKASSEEERKNFANVFKKKNFNATIAIDSHDLYLILSTSPLVRSDAHDLFLKIIFSFINRDKFKMKTIEIFKG